MKNELNINMLLELPSTILKKSEDDINKFVGLLSDNVCNIYYYKNLKSDLKSYFDKFNDMKYIYNISKEYGINLVSNYEIREEKRLIKVNDKVSNFVEKELDKEEFTREVYEKSLSLASKLTYKEAIYFVESFFSNKSDDYISEEIGISRTGLQKIRKSCLVKMYLEFPIEEHRF